MSELKAANQVAEAEWRFLLLGARALGAPWPYY